MIIKTLCLAALLSLTNIVACAQDQPATTVDDPEANFEYLWREFDRTTRYSGRNMSIGRLSIESTDPG